MPNKANLEVLMELGIADSHKVLQSNYQLASYGDDDGEQVIPLRA